MNPVILFRRGEHTDDDEFKAAKQHFTVYENRTAIPHGSLVIPRYAALPFYTELERDLAVNGSRLINSHSVHAFIADLREWYSLIEEFTPKTWRRWDNLPEGMSFVVKGVTNSRKSDWRRRMFAENRTRVRDVVVTLLDDALIADQGIVVREFVPLRTFATGVNGIPITNEWRFVCLNGKIVDSGYYWASEPGYEWSGVDEGVHLPAPGTPAPAPAGAVALVEKVLAKIEANSIEYIGAKVPFVVIDVGEKASPDGKYLFDENHLPSGEWIVIELNDAQQSGLSLIPPERFYAKLAEALR